MVTHHRSTLRRLSSDTTPSRVRSHPRRLSATLPLPLRKRLDASEAYRLEEQLNTQRFERMMNRFQLRRVRSNNTSSVATARCDNSATATPVVQVTVDHVPPPSLSRPLPPPPPPPSPSPPPPEPWLSPTGRLTQVRLLLLLALVSAEAVYLPFYLVYLGRKSVPHVWFDSIVDTVFFFNVMAVGCTSNATAYGFQATFYRAKWREYRKNGLVGDLAAAAHLEWICHNDKVWISVHFLVCLAETAWRVDVTRRHIMRFHAVWVQTKVGTDRSWLSWLLFIARCPSRC